MAFWGERRHLSRPFDVLPSFPACGCRFPAHILTASSCADCYRAIHNRDTQCAARLIYCFAASQWVRSHMLREMAQKGVGVENLRKNPTVSAELPRERERGRKMRNTITACAWSRAPCTLLVLIPSRAAQLPMLSGSKGKAPLDGRCLAVYVMRKRGQRCM